MQEASKERNATSACDNACQESSAGDLLSLLKFGA